MYKVNDIRASFLDYFHRENHEVVASGSLVPHNDPSLMFTNAGMVPFKNVFTGLEKRPYNRAATAQKCVRAGGKHNDLDNVGYTARHHTFFEMLGNFSFGDYFKERAIELSWNLLTKELALPSEKLLITIYHDDEVAANLWQKITGFDERKIIRITTSDNFWSMGDTGPCGPCSEIFYDHGEEIWGGPPGSTEEDGDRFIEIWNLVFMQYEQLAGGERKDLPRPSIDTGMGLERIAAVLQGVHDNYDIDLFRTLISAVEETTNVRASGEVAASHRVIADHLRACAFLIADGVLPSNEGRGYVLRRIMRRAMRHAQLLGAKEPLLWQLLPTLIREMGQAYPELLRAEALIAETLKLEETRFRQTLTRGLGLLQEASHELQKGDALDGTIAFKLYDTYGFPLDLTQDALRNRGISVDLAGFDAAMQRQREEARKNWTGSGETATENLWFEMRESHGATEFLGYENETCAATLTAIIREGTTYTQLEAGQEAMLIVNQSVFYGESGGQVGDSGMITGANFRFRVEDTQKKAESVLVHIGKVEQGRVSVGDVVELKIDSARRAKIRANHSATHLLHKALQQVLGKHVAQKGSLVDSDRLRFDFSHPKPISTAELAKIEDLVNEFVLQNVEVTTHLMEVNKAIETGAMALFGEKYGDEVRVVSMGVKNHNGEAPWSIELCGGTHVRRLGDIGLVHIVSQSSVAAGVRRIEAVTGQIARVFLSEHSAQLQNMATAMKTTPHEAAERLRQILEERRALEKELAEAKRQLALAGGRAVSTQAQNEHDTINGMNFMARIVQDVNPRDLKPLTDAAKNQLGSGIVTFINVDEDNKASIVVGVTDDLTDKISAVELVRLAAVALGGKGGGGRADMAQAGGPDGGQAEQALIVIKQALQTAT